MSYNFLIVDDSSIIRRSLQKALSMANFDINNAFEAANGQEALDLLEHEWIDLIFLDINMPVMNGVEFLRALRDKSETNAIPVLIISTEGSKLRYEELEKLGVQGILRKPVRPEMLTDTVNHLLGGA
ncbi:MAG: response regulator [Deltaproteobacteria bacterium]|nr:response regulator [Deltaproteobacteria bacterium]